MNSKQESCLLACGFSNSFGHDSVQRMDQDTNGVLLFRIAQVVSQDAPRYEFQL
jgi:hypothetical protein